MTEGGLDAWRSWDNLATKAVSHLSKADPALPLNDFNALQMLLRVFRDLPWNGFH